ncbi:MAG: archease [Thermodesulfobacteriota bacterium]
MNYEILDHTADIKIRVFGRDFIDILKNSAFAITDLLFTGEIMQDKNYEFEITGTTEDQILIRLLNELVYIIQTEKLMLKFFDIKKTGKNLYSVNCKGTKIKHSDEMNYDIKGVTYHDLLIENTGNKLKAEFVIDV